MVHALKTYPEYFVDALAGNKNFEVRYKDRDFKVGDILALNEYDPVSQKFTGRSFITWISYILGDEKYCKEGYVILGFIPCRIEIENQQPYKGPILIQGIKERYE